MPSAADDIQPSDADKATGKAKTGEPLPSRRITDGKRVITCAAQGCAFITVALMRNAVHCPPLVNSLQQSWSGLEARKQTDQLLLCRIHFFAT